MSVSILTGYTGTRHITPYMDAVVNRGIFGDEGCILTTGSKLALSMPDINTISMQDGAVSIQGHILISTGETLSVDTCATGNNRIDLVVARFMHNSETGIDSASILLIKGEETSSQYPATPEHNTGIIAEGAAIVDLPLYKLSIAGADVTVERVCKIDGALGMLENQEDRILIISSSSTGTGFRANREDTGIGAGVFVGSGGVNHGVYSWRPNDDGWMIYEDNQGVVRIPSSDIRFGGHASAIGSIVDTYLESDKTAASGKYTALCDISLSAGVWLITAGVRWPGNANGQRAANVSQTSGDNSGYVIASATTGGQVTQIRFSVVVSLQSSKKYYLNAYQNSGGNLTMPKTGTNWGSFMRAVRIV